MERALTAPLRQGRRQRLHRLLMLLLVVAVLLVGWRMRGGEDRVGEADVEEEKDDNIFGDIQWPFSELQIIFKSPILSHFHIN